MMKEDRDRLCIQAVLFDNDGTLVDTGDCISKAFHHAFRTVLGRDYPDEYLLARVGQPLQTQMEILDPEHSQELLEVYREYNRAHHDEQIRAFANTEQVLRDLKGRGRALGVVTSKYHALALHGLELFGLDVYLDTLVGSDDCMKHKPDPTPLLICAERLDVPIGNCIYVGDSPYDIEAANAAGAISVAALWGMFEEDMLQEADPDFMLEDISGLTSLVDRLDGNNLE